MDDRRRHKPLVRTNNAVPLTTSQITDVTEEIATLRGGDLL